MIRLNELAEQKLHDMQGAATQMWFFVVEQWMKARAAGDEQMALGEQIFDGSLATHRAVIEHPITATNLITATLEFLAAMQGNDLRQPPARPL